MEWVLGCLCKFWFYLYNYNCDLYMFDEPIIIVFCKFWFYLVLSVNPKIEFFLLLINVNYILNNIFFNCLFYTNCCLCSISFDDDDQHDIYCNNKSNKLKKVVKLVPSSNFFWYNCVCVCVCVCMHMCMCVGAYVCVKTLGLSAPLSLCWSHMIGIFSQNRVTLTGHLMILLSESDVLIVWCVLLYTPKWSSVIFHWYGTTLHIDLSLILV